MKRLLKSSSSFKLRIYEKPDFLESISTKTTYHKKLTAEADKRIQLSPTQMLDFQKCKMMQCFSLHFSSVFKNMVFFINYIMRLLFVSELILKNLTSNMVITDRDNKHKQKLFEDRNSF